MGNLLFVYGTVNSSKTANMLMDKHMYENNLNKKILMLKPSVDTRDNKIHSRVGLESDCIRISNEEDIRKIYETHSECNMIMVDEAQFLTEKQVEQLKDLTRKNDADIDVYTCGLLTDFRRKLFEGSKALIELADETRVIPSLCTCGERALINGRFIDGVISIEGDQIGIESKEIQYKPLCKDCYEKELEKIKQTNKDKISLEERFPYCGEVILHSFGENNRDFEVIESSILGDCDNYAEDLIVEELGEYSETMKDIHKDLWNKYHTDQSYKIKIGMNFKDVLIGNPFDGYEYDTEVISDYEIEEIGIDISPYLDLKNSEKSEVITEKDIKDTLYNYSNWINSNEEFRRLMTEYVSSVEVLMSNGKKIPLVEFCDQKAFYNGFNDYKDLVDNKLSMDIPKFIETDRSKEIKEDILNIKTSEAILEDGYEVDAEIWEDII